MGQPDWKTNALKALKKRLNAAATQVKIKKISTNPSKKNCTDLYNKLLKKCKGAALQDLQAAWTTYTNAKEPDGTEDVDMPDLVAGGPHAEGDQEQGFRMCGKGFIVTIGDKEGWITHEIYDAFVEWLEKFVKEHRVRFYSYTLEECPTTKNLHIHYMIEWKKAIDWPNTDRLVFQGKRPNVQPNHDTATGHDGKAPRGPAWKQRQSLDAGHFYVYCNKIGTLKSGGNRLPCFDTPGGYVPRPEKTIDPWWMAGKLSDDVYEHYAAKLGRGCDQRLRDVAAKRKFFARDPPYETTHAPIPLSQLPPEVNIWHDQIDKKTDRKFALLLHGPSLTGKTHIARQFAPKAHMYMRSAIDWDHWRVAHENSK